MKNKYSTYNEYTLDYKDYVKYVDMKYYINEYWVEYNPETKEEKLAREKAEKRNAKIDQILV